MGDLCEESVRDGQVPQLGSWGVLLDPPRVRRESVQARSHGWGPWGAPGFPPCEERERAGQVPRLGSWGMLLESLLR